MNPNYNQNYTREEIDAILAKIKACVEKNRYTISLNENHQAAELLSYHFIKGINPSITCFDNDKRKGGTADEYKKSIL